MSGLLSGYRSIPLKNSYSEELELASLLVHIEIVNAKVHTPRNSVVIVIYMLFVLLEFTLLFILKRKRMKMMNVY